MTSLTGSTAQTLHGTVDPEDRDSRWRIVLISPAHPRVRQFWQISAKCCSFSAVSAPIFARKYAFCSIFQNLPDYPTENFEIWQYFANFATFAKFVLNFHKNCWFFKPIFCENFEIAAVQKDANLAVELEKCCQTHIFLQNFVLIQPRTSPLKICKILQNFAKFSNFADPNPLTPLEVARL